MEIEQSPLVAYASRAVNRGCVRGSEALFGTFMLLQEKWVLFILHALQTGPLGFNELRRLASKVNTTTLSHRLDLLERAGLITRTVERVMPPKTSYTLTDPGAALADEVITAVDRWSRQHLPAEAADAFTTLHRNP